MLLTPDQLAAARACGFSFPPATEDQVRRLTVQRRIFRIGGEPVVATRDGGFLETWSTLLALLDKHRPGVPERRHEADAAPPAGNAAPSGAEPPPAPAEQDAAPAERDAHQEAAEPRKARRRRLKPPPASPAATDPVPMPREAATEPSEAEDMLVEIEAAQDPGPRARVVGRRRAGQPPTPRWVVAGKMRRGRLK